MITQYDHLFAAVEACRPRRILEIGTWNGEHGAQMIRIAQRFNPAIEYWGFDLFAHCPEYELPKQPPPMSAALATLQATGATVHLVEGNTRETLAVQWRSLPPMDFIFIDGGHSLETITSDWKYCSKLLHAKTVVMFDDYYPDRTDAGAKPLIDRLVPDSRYAVKIIQPPIKYPVCTTNIVRLTLAPQ